MRLRHVYPNDTSDTSGTHTVSTNIVRNRLKGVLSRSDCYLGKKVH